MSKSKVVILGAGVTAAYVKWACYDSGVDYEIFSEDVVPATPGAFWLRWVPKEIEDKANLQDITVIPTGDAATYVEKQWGNIKADYKSSSFPEAAVMIKGYDPLEVIPMMWGMDDIVRCERITDERLVEFSRDYEVVFVTFPTRKSMKDNSEYRVRVPVVSYPDSRALKQNTVYYNGNPGKIVRMSMIFGSIHIEYVPGSVLSPDLKEIGKVHMVSDIHPNVPTYSETELPFNVYPIGRYAEWKRHMMSHEAYDKARIIINTYLKSKI
jgi:hypothetical protein